MVKQAPGRERRVGRRIRPSTRGVSEVHVRKALVLVAIAVLRKLLKRL
jgi:hypothetical protein